MKTTLLDFPERTACILFTGGCNLRCPYCHNYELVEGTFENISHDEIMKFLNKRKNILEGVVISGGEPCIHNDLPDFIKNIKSLGYLIKLDTNGCYPSMLEKLISSSLLDYIAMDIKAPLADDIMQHCTGVNNINTEGIKKSIDIIMNSGVDFEFRTTLAKELLSFDDVISIAYTIKNAKKFFIQNFKMSENVPYQLSAYDDNSLEKLMQRVQSIIPSAQIR